MVKMAKQTNIGTSECWLSDCLSVWYSSVQSSLCLIYDIVSVEDPGRLFLTVHFDQPLERPFSAPVPVDSRACVEQAAAACAPRRRSVSL